MITNHSFEIIANTYGVQKNEATVNIGDGTVTVQGTVDGRNRCYTAELDDVEYDNETGELVISVRSFEASRGGMCPQGIVEIDYRAQISYEGGAPETVTILHNGETVDTSRSS